jgi:tripartite-type tricarboxylate transporter receptor subunit TctC
MRKSKSGKSKSEVVFEFVSACLRSTIMLAAVSLAVAGQAQAQSWPSKSIRAFIPFGAGSATDIIPRAVFDQLSPALGQPIVIENRGGAGGALGVGEVTRADPDGYTILADSSALTVAPWIVPNLPYDTAKDLSAVVSLGKNANVLVVNPSKGWKTAQDLVAAAKANPGSINYGSAGVGTATHVSAERFRASAGFQATHVPYKGGAEALTDLLGGRIDFYYCPISTALPLIRDGRLIALAVDADARAGSAGRSNLARGRISQFRLHRVVRRVHAVENAARRRAEILHAGDRRVADAGDEAKARAACRRSVPDDARAIRPIRRQ